MNVGKIVLVGLMVSAPVYSAGASKNALVLETYAKIAYDNYKLALEDAQEMEIVISRFAQSPSISHLNAAKKAWLVSRESYGQTEIFRLSEGPIDAEEGWVRSAYGALEGQINAWPLDENMIDYTIDARGKRTKSNIIDTAGSFKPGGEGAKAVDVRKITPAALGALNENGGEANVATGYHAIEFLLWGQDQDYGNFSKDEVSKGALTAGQRPLTDFTKEKYAKRRLDYLKASASHLVANLEKVTRAWLPQLSNNCNKDATGCYRAAFLGKLRGSDSKKNIDEKVAMRQIISGMGVFVKSELANERIAVAVLTPSEEDEHSCFSDNTHRDIHQNYQGFKNVLTGTFNGKSYGPSMYSMVDTSTRSKLDSLTQSIESKIKNINRLAISKWHFDYQILPGNNAKEIKKLKNELRKLGDLMVKVASSFKVNLSSGDVTDPDETKL